MRKLSAVSIFIFTISFLVSAQTASALEWRIPLTPTSQYQAAKAKAKYKDIGGEREFQVEAENLWRLRGAVVSIHVNGALAGRMRINAFGNGRFERNSDLGQRVPAIRRGSTVVIRRGDGVKVFGGKF